MPPDDPLGRHGPSLDNFLRKKPLVQEQKRQHCPYGKNLGNLDVHALGHVYIPTNPIVKRIEYWWLLIHGVSDFLVLRIKSFWGLLAGENR